MVELWHSGYRQRGDEMLKTAHSEKHKEQSSGKSQYEKSPCRLDTHRNGPTTKHSKAKTRVDVVAKSLKRTTGAIRQKAYALGIPVGHRRASTRRARAAASK